MKGKKRMESFVSSSNRSVGGGYQNQMQSNFQLNQSEYGVIDQNIMGNETINNQACSENRMLINQNKSAI